MEYGDKVNLLAKGAIALSAAIILFNILTITLGMDNPLAETISDATQEKEEPVKNETEEKEEEEGYYDKATDSEDSTSSGSKNGEENTVDESGSLNITEKAKIENNFEGYVANSDRDNGIYLDRRAVAGESNSIQIYKDGEPVKEAEVFVNGESVGKTSQWGDIFFTVPDSEEITVSTDGVENLGTVEATFEVY